MATRLTCVESEELLALRALGVLDQADAEGLEEHVRTCAVCRIAARRFRQAAAVLPETLELVEPPASLRRRLMAEVYAGSRRPVRRSRLARFWDGIPAGRPISVFAAGAAAAAVALGIWGATRGTPPAVQTFPVVGTTSEPQARGTLTYYAASSQAVVTVSGLPQPAVGTGARQDVYELWLVPAKGSPLAIAFLAPAPGSQTWQATFNGELTRFEAVAATEEPAGGSTRPTGPELFSVQLTQ